MEYTQSINGQTATMALRGQFTFADHQNFRDLLKVFESNSEINTLVLDFAGVDFIDSAGLGMMLIAREEAGQRNVKLSLINSQGQVEKMFRVSKFETLFGT